MVMDSSSFWMISTNIDFISKSYSNYISHLSFPAQFTFLSQWRTKDVEKLELVSSIQCVNDKSTRNILFML